MLPKMLTRRRSQPELAEVLALAQALSRDEQRRAPELMARETRIARHLPEKADAVPVGLGWLELVENEDETVKTFHQRADAALHLTGLFAIVLAVLLGWGATLGAFYFDGSGRVNAVSVLALLVALPGLFILPFALAALPARLARWVPGIGLIAASVGAVSPARLAPLLSRILPRDLREAIALIAGRLGRQEQLYASLQKWALLRWSQLFAVTFQVSALVACVLLVVFTDLAFGWSTTLTTGDARRDAERVHRVTSTIATPWRWALDDAQPSLALIEESRYFRVAAGRLSPAEAARLGGWWKFVVLTIAVYGLLPRMITFAIARARLHAAARAAVVESPGLSAVLRRIHRARIESAAIEPEAAAGPALGADEGRQPPARGAGAIRAVINWAGVPVGAGAGATAFAGAQVFDGGGAAAMADDVALAKQVSTVVAAGDAAVLIVVKAWEPPLMEFLDFLSTLRGALVMRSTMILVLPVGLDGTAELPAATPAQLKLWRDKLAAIGDPWLRVVASREEVSP